MLTIAAVVRNDGRGLRIDRWAAHALHDTVVSGFGFRAAQVIGTMGDPLPAGIFVLVLVTFLLLLRRWRLAAVAATGQMIIGLATTGLKHVVGRTIHDQLSFPSGHTAQLTGFGLIFGLLVVDWLGATRALAVLIPIGAGLLFGSAMAWSQISGEVHYATDTLGGFCVAVTVVGVMVTVVEAWFDRREQ